MPNSMLHCTLTCKFYVYLFAIEISYLHIFFLDFYKTILSSEEENFCRYREVCIYYHWPLFYFCRHWWLLPLFWWVKPTLGGWSGGMETTTNAPVEVHGIDVRVKKKVFRLIIGFILNNFFI